MKNTFKREVCPILAGILLCLLEFYTALRLILLNIKPSAWFWITLVVTVAFSVFLFLRKKGWPAIIYFAYTTIYYVITFSSGFASASPNDNPLIPALAILFLGLPLGILIHFDPIILLITSILDLSKAKGKRKAKRLNTFLIISISLYQCFMFASSMMTYVISHDFASCIYNITLATTYSLAYLFICLWMTNSMVEREEEHQEKLRIAQLMAESDDKYIPVADYYEEPSIDIEPTEQVLDLGDYIDESIEEQPPINQIPVSSPVINSQPARSSVVYPMGQSYNGPIQTPIFAQPPYERPAQNQVSSPADELRKFKGLLDEGIITEEEFEAKKKQLLGL